MSYKKPEDFAELTTYVNWPLLQEQKLALMVLADRGTETYLTGPEENAVYGIIALLDALQDLAVDSGLVDEEVVFGKQEEDDE